MTGRRDEKEYRNDGRRVKREDIKGKIGKGGGGG